MQAWSYTLIPAAAAVLLPKGVTIRSTQIAGSFAIINGTISVMSRMNASSTQRSKG